MQLAASRCATYLQGRSWKVRRSCGRSTSRCRRRPTALEAAAYVVLTVAVVVSVIVIVLCIVQFTAIVVVVCGGWIVLPVNQKGVTTYLRG